MSIKTHNIYLAVEQPSFPGNDCNSHRNSVTSPYLKFETILVSPVASAAEIEVALLAAADLPPHLLSEVGLKLTNPKDGSLLQIGPNINPNTPDTRYRLHVDYGKLVFNSTAFENMEKILGGSAPHEELTHTLDSLKANIKALEASVRQMSVSKATQQKIAHRKPKSRFTATSKYTFSQDAAEYLKQPQFDNWLWDENEMLGLLELMFVDLGLVEEFQIDIPTLRKFLIAIKNSYNNNMRSSNTSLINAKFLQMYGIINATGVVSKLKPIDKLILLTACIGHDSDHPGFNNAYQINAQTDLAIIYNDLSPLENHHAAVLFTILRSEETNIFKNIPDAVYREVRKGIIRCILATDMAKHGEIMAQFKKYADNFNYDDAEHKLLLLQMIVKCADISNEVRPTDVAEPWVDCLLQEFFAQSDKEKAEGLPTAPFMDRDKVTKASAQVGFIGYVMIPLFELVGKVLPNIEQSVLTPIRQSLAYYKDMLEKDQKKS
ncbi:High affinity cAMP-specific and IBMX-insensitive 3',5'-cyclic phosphodiesterase 9A [Nowakowskiella sp. JEL0407]|nr:High affinity cAMP-specific and IBMX-insensitive 3',5'-cyclic phosphodiesterase 9A [Nowakowskiella sp. JEL0407]